MPTVNATWMPGAPQSGFLTFMRRTNTRSLPSHVLAHEAHPPAQPARAAALDAANTEDAPPLHKGPWPIRNGLNYQPTEQELRALHQEDVTPDQAREIDRLYDQLLAKQ
jgi:hypothetical protein